MADSKKQPSESQGVLGQMSRLKHHSNASADELRQFIQSMKGKSPQQVLGLIAQSDLIRSTAMAAVFFVILLAVLTFVPAMFSGDGDQAVAAAPQNNQQQGDKKERKKQDKTKNAATAKATKDAKGKQPTAKIPDKQDDILKSLDIGDTKTSDPKKNPLDGFDPFKDVK